MLKLVLLFLIANLAFAQVVLPGGPPPVVPPPPPYRASAKKPTESLPERSVKRRCVIELKTGERIEGTFIRADLDRVETEVVGSPIAIAMDKVRTIYFGAAPPITVATPGLLQEALDALKALRSVTNSGVTYHDYSQRVLGARVKVDRYLSTLAQERKEPGGRVVRVAMLEYEVMRHSLNPVMGKKEKALGAIGKIVGDREVVAQCPALKDLTDKSLSSDQRLLKSILRTNAALAWRIARIPHTPDHDDELGLTFLAKQITPADIWGCASDQIAETERSVSER